MKGYVYLFHSEGTSYYKIGKTAEKPHKRMAALQSGNPFTLRLIEAVLFEDMDTKETGMHERYRAYRRNGEWFEFKDIEPVLADLRGSSMTIERETLNMLWDIHAQTEGIRESIDRLHDMMAYQLSDLIHAVESLKPRGEERFIFEDDGNMAIRVFDCAIEKDDVWDWVI